jgi:hypothetical protein
VSLGATDIVGRKFEALDVHGVFLGAFADLLGRDLDAVGQQVAQALTLADHVEQPGHGHVVTEVKVQTACVFESEDAALEEFHGEGDGHTGRHGVKAKFVGYPVTRDDGIGIVHAGDAAKRVQSLVLRSFGEETGIWAVFGNAELAATHRAAGAGRLAHPVGLYRVPPDLVGRGEDAGSRPVLGRIDAQRLGQIQRRGSTVAGELRIEDGTLAHPGHHPLAGHVVLLAVGDGHLGVAPKSDGLEVLAPHDRAKTFASGHPALVYYAGHTRELLARRADAADADVLVVQFVLDDQLGVGAGEAPQFSGVAELDLAVLDPQIGGLFGLALDDDDVVTGALHLYGEVPAGSRHPHGACQRGLGVDGHAACARNSGAGEGARRVDELVLGAQRVAIGRDLVVEILDGQARAADEVLRHVDGEGLLLEGLIREVDPQNLAGIAACVHVAPCLARHVAPRSPRWYALTWLLSKGYQPRCELTGKKAPTLPNRNRPRPPFRVAAGAE